MNYNINMQDGGGKFPDISDDEFYNKINKIYEKFTIPRKKQSLKKICFPKKFELQFSQKFVSQFINPNSPYKGVLVYHKIGAGKTCTAIRVAEEWKHLRNIIVVVPASLKNNFRTELRSLCANNNYLTDKERKELAMLHPSSNEYKEIIKKSDERIDKYYSIYSYNKFTELAQRKKINLTNSLLIIDEIQNMISDEGTYYDVLSKLLKKAPKDLRIILLSATPMFDKPHEIALTLNLLPLQKKIPVGRAFDKLFIKTRKVGDKYTFGVKNLDIFKKSIKGFISYFRGAPPHIFPEMKIKYVKCNMSKIQLEAYKGVLKNEEIHSQTFKLKKKDIKAVLASKLPNNFFIGTRYTSNVVFPNKKVGPAGLKSFKDEIIRKKLKNYSIKFYEIMKRIQKKGKMFIYSSFKEEAGLKSLVKVLEAFGYKNYIKHGEGPKRFAIWSGDEDISVKDEIKNVYNQKSNLNGSKIKILLGSPSIKEGVSLAGVRQVHLLEPNWNISKLQQIIGRASRFCSHKDLEEEERNVKVYIYLATHKTIDESVDEYIKYLSEQKNKLIIEFERAVKEAAIDCKIFRNANYYPDRGEEPIVCDK